MGLFDGREGLQGAVSGAAAGSSFGIVGAAVGGAVGLFAGRKAKKQRRAAERDQLIANTNQSYEIGSSTYSNIKKGRQDAAGNYVTNMASAQAKFAASGGSLTGRTWEMEQGRIATQRDEALAAVDEQQKQWEGSEAFKTVQQDYNQAFGGRYTGKSVTGTDFYTSEQRGNLRTWETSYNPSYEDSTTNLMQQARTDYQKSTSMTFEEFQISQFGTSEQKGALTSEMDQRIEQANATYDKQNEIDKLNREYQQGLY